MNNQPLVVSYYPENTPYEKEIEDLITSSKKFGYECIVEAIPNKGSWSANVCHKPEFLLKCLEKYNRPLIWVDADSLFFQNPTIFSECKADVALRINDHVAVDSPLKILSSTMYINNTASSIKLLNFWKNECEKLLKKGGVVQDQVALRKVILHYPTMVEIKRLPATYVVTTDTAEDKSAFPDNAIVVHYKMARIYENQEIHAGV
ncbi:MAG: glycosyltransferase family 77 protein [Chlamydiae bacterium]|nr:glycosyltransferase family 77 protein [Chlamydiota bacterium]